MGPETTSNPKMVESGFKNIPEFLITAAQILGMHS